MPNGSSDRPLPSPRQRRTQSTGEGGSLTVPAGMVIPISDVERLEKLSPETQQWIRTQVERNLEHLRETDRVGMSNAYRLSLVVLVGSIVAICVGALAHQPVAQGAGGGVAIVDVVALAYVFITRSMPHRPNSR